MGRATKKVPDGKMVEIEVGAKKGSVQDVEISGDFFLEPPKAREKIQEELECLESDATKEKVEENLKDVEADFIGFNREYVAKVFLEALEDERQ